MTREEFEKKHDVKLISKADDVLMRIIAFFSPVWNDFWTTYRLPFGKTRITYSPDTKDPMEREDMLEHELFHVPQFKPFWGPWFWIPMATIAPLPIVFSGRWFLERHAFLNDIRKGRKTVDRAVRTLWISYMLAWPPPLMRWWFNRQLKKDKQ